VAADILTNSQEIARLIEERRRMETSGPLEDGLLFPDYARGSHEKFRIVLRSGGIKVNFSIDLQRLERTLAAHAAARRRIKMTFKTLQIQIPGYGDCHRGIGTLCYFFNDLPVMNNAFRVEEADRQLPVFTRGPHGNRYRLTHQHRPSAEADDDFQRFLHGQLVHIVRWITFENVPADTEFSNAGGVHWEEEVAGVQELQEFTSAAQAS
jgi:hypothetical protein